MSTIHIHKLDDVVEEDFFNKDKAHYITAPPSGVLSVHMKQLRNINEQLIGTVDPELYIRFRVGNFIKITGKHIPTAGTIVFDDTKHVSLTVSRKRSDVKNDVRFDLVLVENSRVHRIVGHKDIHLYDIIKSLYLANTYDIRYRNQIVAKLDLELCFAYGIFGFGFSHQLENRQKKVSDIVSHSLFFRVEPPDYRKQVRSNVITPMPVKHPAIINFTEKANIGGFDLEKESNLPDINMFDDVEIVGESSLLHRLLRRRMNRLQTNFSQLRGRQQRKNFLEKLVLSQIDDHQPVEGQETIPDKTLVGGQRGGATSPGEIVQAPQNLSSSEEEDESVDTLAPMLILAPGLTSRGRGIMELPAISEDEGSISSDSASINKLTDTATSQVPQDNQHEAPDQTTATSTTFARGIARLISLRPWRRTATDNNS